MTAIVLTTEDNQETRLDLRYVGAWEEAVHGGSLIQYKGRVLYVRETPGEIDAQIVRRAFAVPEEVPTTAELAAIRRGRAARQRGDVASLGTLRKEGA
jgi:hypothetical protein